MTMATFNVLVALATLAWAAGQAAGEVCSLEGSLVCGDDGFTYQNACLAEWQGVEVVQRNSCSDRSKSGRAHGNLLATEHLDTAGSVSTVVINRFHDEGFKLVGKVKLADTPLTHPTVAPSSQPPSNVSDPVFAARITPAGHLYLQPEAALRRAMAKAAERGTVSPPFRPAESTSDSSHRKLLVYGADGRVQVKKRTFPYSVVGQLTNKTKDGYILCSGALVGPSTVFTAGHCVYNNEHRLWYKGLKLKFIPGLLSNKTTNKNGTYTWKEINTLWTSTDCQSESCEPRAFRLDFAVVTLAKPPGLGYLGLKVNLGFQGFKVTSAGYPGDKAPGTMWKTSGTPKPFLGLDLYGPYSWINGVVTSDLDTVGGQSGSNVWDSDFYVRALVNAGGSDGRAYHRTVTTSVFHFIMANWK